MNEPLTWNHFGLLLGIIAAWSLVIIATARWTISAGLKGIQDNISLNNKTVDDRIAKQDEKAAKSCESQQRLEREVMEIKADLPICYVRREDFIRNELVINTKLDRLRDLIAKDKESKGGNE